MTMQEMREIAESVAPGAAIAFDVLEGFGVGRVCLVWGSLRAAMSYDEAFLRMGMLTRERFAEDVRQVTQGKQVVDPADAWVL